jgi:hypothetical protein
MVPTIIIDFLGVLLAFVYVGFLAYSIDAVPLWVIVVASCALAVYAMVGEIRSARERDDKTTGF